MIPYFGQFGTDKAIARYFPSGYKGSCVEVGAVDGVKISNTLHFELRGWDCLCIEAQPGPGYFADLAKNRRAAINVAVGSSNRDDAEFSVVYCNGKPWNGMSGLTLDSRLLEQHRSMGYEIRIEKIAVPMRRLDWCIENYFRVPVIDFMSIDVEGTELDVLQSFDLKAYKTKLFVIENNFEDSVIRDFMVDQGFRLDKRVEVNEFYVRAD